MDLPTGDIVILLSGDQSTLNSSMRGVLREMDSRKIGYTVKEHGSVIPRMYINKPSPYSDIISGLDNIRNYIKNKILDSV